MRDPILTIIGAAGWLSVAVGSYAIAQYLAGWGNQFVIPGAVAVANGLITVALARVGQAVIRIAHRMDNADQGRAADELRQPAAPLGTPVASVNGINITTDGVGYYALGVRYDSLAAAQAAAARPISRT